MLCLFRKGDKMALKNNEINILLKKEKKFIEQKPLNLFKKEKETLSNIFDEKVPEKVRISTEATFESSFEFIFEKGDSVLEKTYSKEKILNEYEKNKNKFNSNKTKSNLRSFDRSVKISNTINTAFTGIKSTAMGVLGVGMPDIPVFIGEIIRTIYQTGLKYGYDHKTENEKIYILSVIGFGLSCGKEREYYSNLCDDIAYSIEKNSELKVTFSDIEKKISALMVSKVCGLKIVQGIFVIGIISSFGNISVMDNISKGAYLKYKKRFIMYKLVNKN